MTVAFQRMFGILERCNNNQVTPSLSKPHELSYRSNILYSWYRNREYEFLSFFEQAETLVYCTNVPKLMRTLGLKDYNADEFRLFIDSSKRKLKAVLLSNENKVASVP